MKENDDGLDYLQMMLRMYMDHEDEMMSVLLLRISKSLERVKVCA
jgi:hypothetical protein